jgi:tetrahydromethanopterin S-methyltransferase subunit H
MLENMKAAISSTIRNSLKLFEEKEFPNNSNTRKMVVDVLSEALSKITSHDYVVICDERNNPPVRDPTKIMVDIYVKENINDRYLVFPESLPILKTSLDS